MNDKKFNDQFDAFQNDIGILTEHDPTKPHSSHNPLPGYTYLDPVPGPREENTLIDLS